jgi:hypothetical protein
VWSAFSGGAVVVAILDSTIWASQGYMVTRGSSLPNFLLTYGPWLGPVLGLGVFWWIVSGRTNHPWKWLLLFGLFASFIAVASIGVVPLTVEILGVKGVILW